jgi:hypothetical protein
MMRPRTLAVLVVLGIAALAGGWYWGAARSPDQSAATDAGRPMFPALGGKLDQAASVVLRHGAITLRIVRNPTTKTWGLAERGFYPVDVGKLRGLLMGLSDLRLIERRTAEPAELSRLGLEDPTGRDATSTLIEVLDAAGKPLAALVAGHSRLRTAGNLPAQVYVRRPDQTQTWLAEGRLDLDADPLTWLDRDVMDIKPDRIASVSVTTPAGHLLLTRAGAALALAEPAEHPRLDAQHLRDVEHALDLLTLEDVRPDATAPAGTALGSAVFTTKDGLAITATCGKAADDLWVRFTAAATSGAGAEAAALNARLAGWSYRLGDWKQAALVPTIGDLTATPPASPAPAQAQSAPAPSAPTQSAPAQSAPAQSAPAPSAPAPSAPAPAPADPPARP